MRKIRIVLALSTVPLAIGGAFAHHSLFDFTYFEFVDGILFDRCDERTVTDPCTHMQTSAICATLAKTNVQLGGSNNPSTQCAPPMWKLNP